ncbi:MAG TPA: hypothetical protein VHC18_22170 [Amycolatopsis sp.]|nr:hypothetical protein [Amycolatopsis sp.]
MVDASGELIRVRWPGAAGGGAAPRDPAAATRGPVLAVDRRRPVPGDLAMAPEDAVVVAKALRDTGSPFEVYERLG